MSNYRIFKFENFSHKTSHNEKKNKLLKFKIEKNNFKYDEFFKESDDKIFSKWIDKNIVNEKTYEDRIKEYFKNKKIEFDKKIEDYFNKKKEEADNIVKQAVNEAEEIKKQKEKEGFEQGYKKGYEQGYKEIIEKESKNFEYLKKIVENLSKKEKKLVEKFDSQIANIIIELTKKIIKQEIEFSSKDVVFNNLKHILSKAVDKSNVIITVSEEDYDFVKKHINDFNLENVKLLKSDKLERGDVIVETLFGTYDATISSQIDEFEKLLKDSSSNSH